MNYFKNKFQKQLPSLMKAGVLFFAFVFAATNFLCAARTTFSCRSEVLKRLNPSLKYRNNSVVV